MATGSWDNDDFRYLNGLRSGQSRRVIIDDYSHERRLYSIMAIVAGFFLLIDIIHSLIVDGHPTRNLSSGGGLVLLFLLNLMLSYRADTLVKVMKALDLMSGGSSEPDEEEPAAE